MFKRTETKSTLIEPVHDSVGKLVLRLTTGGLMLFHGIDKLQNGIGFILNQVTEAGLPAFFAYGVYVGEVVVPVLLLLGLWTRLSAIVLAFNMVVAIALVHGGHLLSIGDHGEWAIEAAAFYLLNAIAIAWLGPGKYALGRKEGLLA